MTVEEQGGGNVAGGGGFITGGLAPFLSRIQGQGQLPVGPTQTVWEQLLNYFSHQYPARGLPTGLRDPSGTGRIDFGAQREAERQRRLQQQDRARLVRLAREAGLDPTNSSELANFWAAAVREAEAAYSVDPRADELELVWDVLERWARDGAPGTFKADDTLRQRKDEWYGEQEPWTETRTDESVQITDPDTAREVAKEAFRRRFHREPSNSEMSTFTASLNAYERNNPSTTTTITQYGADGTVLGTESSTEEGGTDPASFAMQFREDEMDAEERAVRAGIEYGGVIDALVGGF